MVKLPTEIEVGCSGKSRKKLVSEALNTTQKVQMALEK